MARLYRVKARGRQAHIDMLARVQARLRAWRDAAWLGTRAPDRGGAAPMHRLEVDGDGSARSR